MVWRLLNTESIAMLRRKGYTGLLMVEYHKSLPGIPLHHGLRLSTNLCT
jgi:hypothetical protein